MRQPARWIAAALLGLVLLGAQQDADAVIKAESPLKSIELYARFILVGKVEKYLPDRPAMLVRVTEDIKGKAPFRLLPINCQVTDAKVVKENLIEPLLKRFGPDLDIIFFVTPRGNDSYITFAFTNGTWFQLQGQQVGEKENVVFSLKSAEPYYRKSFQGTTEELRKVLKDFIARKTALPPLDSKVEPGFGPEYDAKPRTDRRNLPPGFLAWRSSSYFAAPGSRLAVIPTVGIGAPLAILALLFPTVFGGVFVLFRQWMAFITLLSLNSTILILHWWLAPVYLRGTWWSTSAAVWFLMTLFTLLCTLWAWRRQLRFLYSGADEAPAKTEQMVLLIMSVSCLATTFLMWYLTPVSWTEIGWALTVVMTMGVVAGTICRFLNARYTTAIFATPGLATEGTILGTMLLGHLAFAPAIWGGGVRTEGTVATNEGAGTTTAAEIGRVVEKWNYPVDVPGMFASSPVVHGDSIYAAYSETVGRVATLICLDRQTRLKKWEFLGKNNDLVQMISTPCLADGMLYFGEGFHDDPNCKVYCVEAANGKEVWQFKTAGQTESSPTVGNGKVYIGAGNDGVYCLNAKNGAKIWRYPPDDYKGRLLRFGGGMHLVGNRLYCGTGIDRNQKNDKGETAILCLDATTGKPFWKSPSPYPIWTTPVTRDNILYVTTGNGDVFTDAQPPEVPGGALLSLDADSGKELWRFPVGNGIMESPAVDGHRIYFGCRDGQVYCIGRADGKERWKCFLYTPVIGTPTLDGDPVHGRTVSVFAAGSGGKVCCLNPQTGEMVWTYDLTERLAYISTTPRLVVTTTPAGYRRQLYFGAGIGGGTLEFGANRPVFYCLEDHVKVE